jgi:hypothetical protein
MSRARNRLPAIRVLSVLGLAGAWAVACGGPQPLGSTGSVCFRADECQAGLACIPETVGATKHVCSADLSGIVAMVDGAPPDDMPDASGGATGEPQGGSPATGGAPPSAGASGKAAVGGAPGVAGAPSASGAPGGGSGNAGAPAGGASEGGAANGGAAGAGASAGKGSGAGTSGGGAANGGASAGTGG